MRKIGEGLSELAQGAVSAVSDLAQKSASAPRQEVSVSGVDGRWRTGGGGGTPNSKMGGGGLSPAQFGGEQYGAPASHAGAGANYRPEPGYEPAIGGMSPQGGGKVSGYEPYRSGYEPVQDGPPHHPSFARNTTHKPTQELYQPFPQPMLPPEDNSYLPFPQPMLPPQDPYELHSSLLVYSSSARCWYIGFVLERTLVSQASPTVSHASILPGVAGGGPTLLTIRFFVEGDLKEKKLPATSTCLRKVIGDEEKIPDGFQRVESRSNPGKFSFLDRATGVRYATMNLAWDAHFRTLFAEEISLAGARSAAVPELAPAAHHGPTTRYGGPAPAPAYVSLGGPPQSMSSLKSPPAGRTQDHNYSFPFYANQNEFDAKLDGGGHKLQEGGFQHRSNPQSPQMSKGSREDFVPTSFPPTVSAPRTSAPAVAPLYSAGDDEDVDPGRGMTTALVDPDGAGAPVEPLPTFGPGPSSQEHYLAGAGVGIQGATGDERTHDFALPTPQKSHADDVFISEVDKELASRRLIAHSMNRYAIRNKQNSGNIGWTKDPFSEWNAGQQRRAPGSGGDHDRNAAAQASAKMLLAEPVPSFSTGSFSAGSPGPTGFSGTKPTSNYNTPGYSGPIASSYNTPGGGGPPLPDFSAPALLDTGTRR